MPLRSLGFADLSRLGTQVATTSGHLCPPSADRCGRQRHCALGTFFVIGIYSRLRIGIVRALCKLCNTADT